LQGFGSGLLRAIGLIATRNCDDAYRDAAQRKGLLQNKSAADGRYNVRHPRRENFAVSARKFNNDDGCFSSPRDVHPGKAAGRL
jgi:hypothetical protein